jgi:two-component system sensor histidine kinase KdpD
VGLVETHGRRETAALIDGIEVIPRLRQEYRGVPLEEMDVDAILARKPEVVLVDELAHTDIPGSRNAKRYEDVQDILNEGIHVIATLNVQHLESLYNTVETTVGIKVRERLPDSVLGQADQIVNVDLTEEDLQRRLREGKIYPQDRIETALGNFFVRANLEQLREMTLRELASQIDIRRREPEVQDAELTPDQVMVCLSSAGPNSEMLLRYASRLAGRLNRNWYALYVQTPREEAAAIDAAAQSMLSGALTLAKQLGAMVFTYRGEDVAETILRFAKEYRVGHVVVGSPAPLSFWDRLTGRLGIADRLLRRAEGITVVVLDTRTAKPGTPLPAPEPVRHHAPPAPAPSVPRLSNLLSAAKILIWDEPVLKENVLAALTRAALKDDDKSTLADAILKVYEREQQGSTFFNEGVAFPHARLLTLREPCLALGLTRHGIANVTTDKPIDLVFLILSPAASPNAQLQLLALTSRAAQSRHLLQKLRTAASPDAVMRAIQQWEELQRNAPSQ